MAQTVEEIAEILEEMRTSGKNEVQLIENALIKIQSTLEEVTNNKEALELMKLYTQDTKKYLEDNGKISVDRLNEIQSLLHNKLRDLNEIESENFSKISSFLNDISEYIKLINFKTVFEEFSQKISDVKETFEKSSKINYNSLILELSNMSKAFSESFTYLDSNRQAVALELKQELSSILDNMQKIAGNNEKFEIISDALKEINFSVEKLSNNAESNIQLIQPALENIAKVVYEVKADILNTSENNSSIFSAELSNVKTLFENIQSKIVSIEDLFEKTSNNNVFNILGGIKELEIKVDELKTELAKPDYQEKILDYLTNISLKIETIADNSSFDKSFDYLNECISKISSDLILSKEEQIQTIQSGFERNSTELKTVFDNINELKSDFIENINGLKTSFAEIDESVRNIGIQTGESLSDRLVYFETLFNDSIKNYDDKLLDLRQKIADFVNIVENSNSDTEGKIASSFEEIISIKSELLALHETLKNSFSDSNNRLHESITLVDNNIGNIISEINTVNEAVKQGISENLGESINKIEEKFSQITEYLSEIKSDNDNKDFVADIYEKISSLKDEITLINTDIASLIINNKEETVTALDNLKTDVSEFVNLDFEKVLSDLKSQLEMSLMNLSVEVNTELVSNSKSLSNLEEVYKEAYNKLNNIEEIVGEKFQNDIELLNTTLESASREIKSVISENFDEKFENLTTSVNLAINDTKIEEAVNDLKSELSDKMDLIIDNHNISSNKQNEILSGISSVTDNMKNLVVKLAEVIINKCNPQSHKELLEGLRDDNSVLKENLGNINLELANLGSKIGDFDAINSKLEVLHAKVDVLASNDSDINLINEIEEIKDIIFEQRKFLETSTDEKTAAIDKYLKDVLIKIENVDIEKNSEDIKETILNALVSLFDQISFVEETEELKDFVEEKTDLINQNLLDVKDKLKQLVNPADDDFNYVYTLQDVESDIAKLRLAINNIQDNDFSDITDEMKRVLNSVENLESALTQEQIEKLKEDILSISTRTNKLLLTSDESVKTLNEGLNNFENIIYANREIAQRLENKLDNVQNLAQSSVNADKVFHQTMMYLGEWIDSTTENITAISEKAANIPEIQQNIAEMKSSIPESSKMLELFKLKFDEQEKRIENLEDKLENILAKIEDNSALIRKTEKIEKLISGLSANVEKLTSYVDE